MKLKKKVIVSSIYIVSLSLIVGSIVYVVNGVNKYLGDNIDYNYAIKNVFNNVIPVVGSTNEIIRPYLSEEVSIGKYFYDYEGNEQEQEKSLVYYENTYMQNSGVDYVSTNTFDIVSILDGEVIYFEKDETLGNVIQIKHEKDIVSIYQGLDEVNINKGDKVNQGQILGVSSSSKINPEYASSFHFEIYYKGEIMDPENLYSLSIEDF